MLFCYQVNTEGIKMEYAYHWVDGTGKIHYTRDREEAERSLHSGNFIELVILDNQHKDGSDRTAG